MMVKFSLVAFQNRCAGETTKILGNSSEEMNLQTNFTYEDDRKIYIVTSKLHFHRVDEPIFIQCAAQNLLGAHSQQITLVPYSESCNIHLIVFESHVDMQQCNCTGLGRSGFVSPSCAVRLLTTVGNLQFSLPPASSQSLPVSRSQASTHTPLSLAIKNITMLFIKHQQMLKHLTGKNMKKQIKAGKEKYMNSRQKNYIIYLSKSTNVFKITSNNTVSN